MAGSVAPRAAEARGAVGVAAQAHLEEDGVRVVDQRRHEAQDRAVVDDADVRREDDARLLAHDRRHHILHHTAGIDPALVCSPFYSPLSDTFRASQIHSDGIN